MPPEGCGGSRVSLFLGLESASLVPEERGEMPWVFADFLRVFAARRRHSQWWGEGGSSLG